MSSHPPYLFAHPGQADMSFDFNQRVNFTANGQGDPGTHATDPPMPQPVPAQQTGPAMAVQPIPQTPQAAALEQETHDANSVVTENAGSDPAPAEMLDYSWHPVAAQGDHAIFNDGGIFYGTELKKRTTKNGRSMRRIFISPTLKHLCIPADRHGHNDLDVGQWFANRTIAFFHGAHGAFQHGIVGIEDGAFSVVITPAAGMADIDNGYRVLYVGPEGHQGCRCLEKSHQTGNPVRVLRAAGNAGDWPWAPRAGIRYDGLYKVVGISEVQPATASASESKTFRHFEMRRLPGQTPLEELCNISPSAEELNQFQGYRDLLESIVV